MKRPKLNFQILPAITALIDKKLKLNNGQVEDLSLGGQQQPPKRAIIMRELAVQTSIDFEKPQVAGRLNNVSTLDKATQSSLISLHEIGTQTKKSATKKKEKKEKSKKDSKETEDDPNENANLEGHTEEDPVLKLLSPV